MDRAAHILATRPVEPSGDDGSSWWVTSESQAHTQYLVLTVPRGPWPCTCQDYARRRDWCKHALAVALLRKCEAYEARHAPIPLPVPPLDPDAPIPFVLTPKALAALDDSPAPVA
jgi:hypothetical protein